ncbi:MAG: GNAT family N-acetyltransferase [Acidimicrobiia bacterium]|nr:GNAT family N-acetyltransferase [Acidimicrobiia bacterium]
MNVRPARPDDEAAVVAFTTGTFEWGDYVPDSFGRWMAEDDNSNILVATDDADRPVGMVRIVMMSSEEAWLHAARVHPDARRRGIAAEVTKAANQWAADQGARVARLLTETWNTAAQAQVRKAGYRDVSTWFYAVRQISSTQPNTSGNGGKRVPGEERLTPAPAAEAEPAFLSWSSGDLIRHSRSLFPISWMFRSLRLEDLAQAAKDRRFWGCPAGWVIGEFDDDSFHVSWMSTGPEDVYPLTRALLDRATDMGAERLTALVPAVGFVEKTFQRIGAELHHDILWEYAL